MPLTNFPNGVSSFGIPLLGAPGGIVTTGKMFFVHYGTGANGIGRGSDPTVPLKTLAYAIGLCTANKGDTIVLMPGHVEDVVAAGTITLNKAGVQIIGLGSGSLRPTFTFKTISTATIAISAANVFIQNVIFDYTGVDAIATGLNITGAYCWIYDCRFLMSNVTNQAAVAVTLAATATAFRAIRCMFLAPDAGATAAITGAVALDRIMVRDCNFSGDFSTAAINNATNAWTNVEIVGNLFYILGTGKSVVLVSTATGFIANNHSQITANIAAGGSMTAAAALKSNNLAQETAGIASSTVLDPTSAAIT